MVVSCVACVCLRRLRHPAVNIDEPSKFGGEDRYENCPGGRARALHCVPSRPFAPAFPDHADQLPLIGACAVAALVRRASA